MSFKEWFDNADYPQRDENGEWFDLEDGIPYRLSKYAAEEKKKEARKQLSSKALEGRAVAKLFGGYALKGSAKQKEWAEKIRADKLKEMNSFEIAEYFCDKDNTPFQSAAFWIENRNKSALEFEDFIDEIVRLNIKVREAQKTIKQEKRKMGKKRYNRETKEHEEYFVDINVVLDSAEYGDALNERREFFGIWGV